MAKAVIRRGTAAEGAEHIEGLSANGLGAWTRTAAAGNVKMRSEDTAPEVPAKKPWADRQALLHANRAALSKLNARLAREQVPERITKLRQQIDAKRGYIEKLQGELQ